MIFWRETEFDTTCGNVQNTKLTFVLLGISYLKHVLWYKIRRILYGRKVLYAQREAVTVSHRMFKKNLATS
jgi:hypothetical protein